MAQIIESKILKNTEIGPGYFKMIFSAPQIARESRAGQFVNMRCLKSPDLLLRRPFSIYRVCGDNVEILYRVAGKGTVEIAKGKQGEIVDVVGPLGNGFQIPKDMKSALLVAGGMGVAPLVMMAQKIKSVKCQVSGVRVLIGAKSKEEILCENEFKKLGCEVEVATEDGSKSFKGLVTELLGQLLSTFNFQLSTVIYACGPKPMLKRVAEIAKKRNIQAQVSMEENMACGIGVCYGCPVETKDGYKLVCKDGPVFDANKIVWE